MNGSTMIMGGTDIFYCDHIDLRWTWIEKIYFFDNLEL